MPLKREQSDPVAAPAVRPEEAVFVDSRGNRDFQCQAAFYNSELLRPVHDEARLKASGRPLMIWPNGKRFAACLTHDVDRVTHHSSQEACRRLLDVRRVRGASHRLSILKRQLLNLGRAVLARVSRRSDPFWSFEKWLEVESRYGGKSTFFFFPDEPSRYHTKDCRYRFADRVRFEGRTVSVADVMRELDARGWDVGLHTSYHAFDNADEIRRQKQQIERVLNHQIACNRQHTLHFDMGLSPRVIHEAGFRYDSSPGFNRIVGFRFGTALPFRYLDASGRSELPLVHIPLQIMDTSLFRGDNLDLNEDGAFFYCKLLIDRVEAVGGVITLSWHHGTQAESVFPGWFRVYERCLAYMNERGAWLASMREIGDWYRRQEGLE